MGGGILSNLMRKADDKILKGIQKLDQSHPNGIGISMPLLKERTKQRLMNVNDVFSDHSMNTLLGKNNVKINNAGGLGGTSILQDAYKLLTQRK